MNSNWEYRNFLVKNADHIIQTNQINACNKCGGIIKQENFTNISCKNSDLKNVYLSSQQLQSRMTAPILTQEQYLVQQYPNPN